MPLLGYFYANVFRLNNEHAIGLMLIAMAPGGVTTNLITYWSNGDVMLSITMSAVSTTLAFGMMPLLIEVYINTTFTDGGLNIPYELIVITLLLLLVPTGIGVFIRAKSEIWAKRLEKFGSVLGVIFLFVALIWALLADSHLLDQSFGLWWSCATLQVIGCFFAYGIAALFGLRPIARRTIGIEAGIQNSTLIITLIGNSFDDKDERIKVFTPVFLYSVSYFFNSIWIMLFFRWISNDEKVEQETSDVTNGNKDGVKLEQVVTDIKVEGSKGEAGTASSPLDRASSLEGPSRA